MEIWSSEFPGYDLVNELVSFGLGIAHKYLMMHEQLPVGMLHHIYTLLRWKDVRTFVQD